MAARHRPGGVTSGDSVRPGGSSERPGKPAQAKSSVTFSDLTDNDKARIANLLRHAAKIEQEFQAKKMAFAEEKEILEERLVRLRLQNQDVIEQTVSLRAEINRLQSVVGDHADTISALESAGDEAVRAKETAENRSQTLEKEVAALQRALLEKDFEVTTAKAEVEAARRLALERPECADVGVSANMTPAAEDAVTQTDEGIVAVSHCESQTDLGVGGGDVANIRLDELGGTGGATMREESLEDHDPDQEVDSGDHGERGSADVGHDGDSDDASGDDDEDELGDNDTVLNPILRHLAQANKMHLLIDGLTGLPAAPLEGDYRANRTDRGMAAKARKSVMDELSEARRRRSNGLPADKPRVTPTNIDVVAASIGVDYHLEGYPSERNVDQFARLLQDDAAVPQDADNDGVDVSEYYAEGLLDLLDEIDDEPVEQKGEGQAGCEQREIAVQTVPLGDREMNIERPQMERSPAKRATSRGQDGALVADETCDDDADENEILDLLNDLIA